jgi:hypothetical protein
MPKTKSKNLNVEKEYEKSGMKRMANFVVIGERSHTFKLIRLANNEKAMSITARVLLWADCSTISK